jgi:hypothetical protein
MQTLIPVSCLELRRGPLNVTLTDLDQSTLFVDDQWRINCLVDLE